MASEACMYCTLNLRGYQRSPSSAVEHTHQIVELLQDPQGNEVACATANFDATKNICYIYDKLPEPNGPGAVVEKPNEFIMGEKFCLPSSLILIDLSTA